MAEQSNRKTKPHIRLTDADTKTVKLQVESLTQNFFEAVKLSNNKHETRHLTYYYMILANKVPKKIMDACDLENLLEDARAGREFVQQFFLDLNSSSLFQKTQENHLLFGTQNIEYGMKRGNTTSERRPFINNERSAPIRKSNTIKKEDTKQEKHSVRA